MNMMKKLMLILFLGMIMSGPGAPILKSFVGLFGSTTAYAQDNDDQGDDNDDQGDDNDNQ